MRHNKYSDLKIFSFPEKIKAFQEGRITAPLYVRIKPTNRCQHACDFCTYSDGTTRPKDDPAKHLKTGMHTAMRERDVMPWEKLSELLDNLKEMDVKALTFSGGGEPLIYAHICDGFRKALDLGIDLSIITNGQSLSGERAELLARAKWVRVSIDYTTQEQMVSSRHVPDRFYGEVLKNLRSFADMKSEGCDLGINFIVTRYNYDGLVPFARILKESGVENIRFSPVFVSGFKEYHMPIRDRVLAQLAEAQSLCDARFSINTTYDLDSPSKQPTRPFTRCLYAQTVPVVGADLGVYACHNQAYSEKGRIGSIAHQTFKEMWFSEETKKFFAQLNPSCDCTNIECANQSKVVLFNSLADTHDDSFV